MELLGRGPELEALYRLIDRDDGSGGAVVLHGDPGIGKSALLAAVRRRAEQKGLRRLETGGAQTETELPFCGLERLLRPVLSLAQGLPDRQRFALLGAVGAMEGSSSDLFLIALGALNVITEAAAERRLLLLIDDAQWLDRGTADVLAFIARRIEDEPIAMVVALRDGYASPLAETKLDELAVRALDEGSARELVDARLPQLGTGDRERVLAEASGNPLALIELADSARSAPADGDGQLPGRLPLTARLERTFAARADDLPDVTRAVLLVAATDDRGVLAEVLAASGLYLGTQVAEQALLPATDIGLIELDGIRIVFPNPLVRSAVYQAASDRQRRQVHAALAVTLDGQPDRVAWHRAAAASAPDEAVARELESVATRAERRGAIATAVGGLERAAVLSTDADRRVDRLLRASELAVELGRADLVGGLLARVSDEDLTPLMRARSSWIRDRLDDRTPGDASRILELVEDARRAAADGETGLALELLLAAAWRTWWVNTDEAVRDRVIGSAETLAVEPADPRLLAVLAVAGPVKCAAIVSERLTGAPIGSDDDATDQTMRGLAAHTIGQSELAVQLLAGAAATLRAQGRLGLLARVLATHAWSAIELGNWSKVDMMGNEATRLARETTQPLWAAAAQAAEAAAAGMRGDADLAAELGAEVEREALPVGLRNVLCVLQIARGITALGQGRYGEAYDDLIRVFDPADLAYHHAERHGAIGYLAEAAVHSGRHAQLATTVEELERIAQLTPATLLRLGLLYARPLLADTGEAEPLFVAALADGAARWPFFRARVQMAYGDWLRRQRRMSESRNVLRIARDAFDAIGATPWSDRVRDQLRASGETSAASAPPALQRLTPQQRQIAELAAAGLTNREIGEQLFLSPRTVSSHLYRLFPKLGIASRAELSGALARAEVQAHK